MNIPPNNTGLPGIALATNIVGALLTFGLIAALAGLVISAVTWAFGSHSANPHLAGRGKTGVLVSLAAALLVGGSQVLIGFFSALGPKL